MLIPLIAALLQAAPLTVPEDTQPRFRPDSADLATAYADPATAELVRLARRHRGQIDASVFRYRATVRQRISVGIRALRRDRIVYRRESASLIDWRRDQPGTVEVLGAREAVPVAIPGLRIPDDLEEWAREMVPSPGEDQLMISPTEDGFAWHPLIEGGEDVYTYAIGGTTEIRLPNGRTIRLIELRVTPRERDIRLITGSFWIDEETHAIVQAVFRPSSDFDLERDLAEIDPGEQDDLDEVPELLKPIRLDIRYMSIEYGLWEMRWWMPRFVVLEASLQMGAARFPLSFEVVYSDYEIEEDRHGLPELPPVIRHIAGDPSSRPRPYEPHLTVVIRDSATLLTSEFLPESFYEGGSMITEQEMRDLAGRVGTLPAAPWEVRRPRFTWPWELARGVLRYNRVEGLSAGARMDLGLGPADIDVTARIGTADLVPNAEIGVTVPTVRREWRFAAYHRLAAAEHAARPFSLGASAAALLWGRDDGTYFRATGAETRIAPAAGAGGWAVRLYAERQTDVDANTAFSGPRLFDAEWRFRPNIEADPATQVGVAASLGFGRGLDPGGWRFNARLDATAETGDFTFVRPAATASLGFPLPGRFLGAAEVAGGTTVSDAAEGEPRAPAQSLWYLGGSPTVRGFDGAAASGADFLRARLEVGTAFPAARLALFGDAGWAGGFDTLDSGDVLTSAGIGASFLDGLLRLDLARTIRPSAAWRLDLYLDALF